MNIKAKIDLFCDLLLSYYSKEAKEDFYINDGTLKGCGFNDTENPKGVFWNVVCHHLIGEGILKSYTPTFRSDLKYEPIIPPEMGYYHYFEINGKKLKERLKEASNKEITEEIQTKDQTRNNLIIRYTKEGVELKFNQENGDVRFGKAEGNLAPDTGEYKVFLYLLRAPSHMAKYADLLKLITGKALLERLALDSTIRNIKRELKILPQKQSLNKDIFRTQKSWKGYRLMVID